MKDSSKNAVIILAIIVIVVLSILLIQAQQTIESQRATIASQEAQISNLEAEVKKLSEISTQSIVDDAKNLILEQGTDFLRNLTQEALQDVQNN